MCAKILDSIGFVSAFDPEIAAMMNRELDRQEYGIELIASENFASPAVIAAMGSVLTNKYAEGLPGKRYYGGCHFVDELENLCIERAKKLFGAEFANVQPHSGAQANMAKYLAAKASWEAANVCMQTHGGFGFANEYDIERKFRETRLYQVAPISTNLILSYVAEHMLGLPRSF